MIFVHFYINNTVVKEFKNQSQYFNIRVCIHMCVHTNLMSVYLSTICHLSIYLSLFSHVYLGKLG